MLLEVGGGGRMFRFRLWVYELCFEMGCGVIVSDGGDFQRGERFWFWGRKGLEV